MHGNARAVSQEDKVTKKKMQNILVFLFALALALALARDSMAKKIGAWRFKGSVLRRLCGSASKHNYLFVVLSCIICQYLSEIRQNNKQHPRQESHDKATKKKMACILFVLALTLGRDSMAKKREVRGKSSHQCDYTQNQKIERFLPQLQTISGPEMKES